MCNSVDCSVKALVAAGANASALVVATSTTGRSYSLSPAQYTQVSNLTLTLMSGVGVPVPDDGNSTRPPAIVPIGASVIGVGKASLTLQQYGFISFADVAATCLWSTDTSLVPQMFPNYTFVVGGGCNALVSASPPACRTRLLFAVCDLPTVPSRAETFMFSFHV